MTPYMWHYVHQGQSLGPFTEVEMNSHARNGAVTAQTFVWREGMTEWLPAAQTPLANLFATISSLPSTAVPAKATHEPAPEESSAKKKLLSIGTIIGAVAGYSITRMLPGKVVIRIFAGGIAGTLCGLIPYFVGRNRRPKLAKSALAWCAVAGCLLGILLALPLAIAFTIALLVKEPEAQAS